MKPPKKICKDCRLSSASRNCVSGWGNPEAKLVILLDCPGDLLAEKLLVWIMRRMNLDGNDVWIDYVFKCPIPKGLKKAELKPCHSICWTSHPRKEVLDNVSLVVAGNWGVDFVLDEKMKDFHGRKEPESGAWVCYSFKYLLMNPAECVDNWRVIFKAAQEAGLDPKMIVNVPPFHFPSKKMVAA